jgi:folate-dependent phosphoribosylglycinamide formyltransferase PurN
VLENNQKVVLLCTNGDSTRAVYQALKQEFGDITVIMEDDVPRSLFLKRRLKKLGFFPVLGQLLFMLFVVPILRLIGKKRLDELKSELKIAEIENVTRVDSVNSLEGRKALIKASPHVVVVNGTRIIGKATLESVTAKFINMHAGITPLYRGVHGGYWALAENNPQLVGTTVHFVDTGIDTGEVIEQSFFDVSARDNFVTYPYLHTKAGISVLINAVGRSISGDLQSRKNALNLPSKLRHHPTIWMYLYYLLKRGVK